MSKTISLTSDQLDHANQSLDRATAILELVSDCGASDSYRDDHPMSTVYIVADVAKEELGKVQRLLNPEDSKLKAKTAPSPL